MAAPRKIKLTPKERLAQSRQFWVPPGTPVEVRGRTLPDGMVYVGSGIGALSVNEPVEPAAIDPAHKGARKPRVVHSYNWNSVYYGWNTSYPSFARLTKPQQEAYLSWLAIGRPPTDEPDFLWIYFYGIERRLMFDGRQDAAAKAEEPLLLSEIAHLIDVHTDDGNDAFYNAALALSIAVEIRSGTFDINRSEVPLARARDGWSDPAPMSLALTYTLGVCGAERRPLPARWALAWMSRYPPNARRLNLLNGWPEGLNAFFLEAYRQEYGDGLILGRTYYESKPEYFPSSPSFAGGLKIGQRKLPWHTYPSHSAPELNKLAQSVVAEWELIERIFERASGDVDAGVEERPDLESMLASVRATLEPALGERPFGLLPMAYYHALLPTDDDREIPKLATAMIRILRRLGYGIEPNPQTERNAFTKSTHIGLYRIEAKPTEESAKIPAPNPFKLAALLIFAGSDGGHVSSLSRAAAQVALARRYEFSSTQRNQLEARIAWQVLHPLSYAALRPALGNPLDWPIDSVRDDLVTVAISDGAPSPQRIKELAKVYKFFGLDAEELHSDLHRVSTGGTLRSAKGEAIELDPQKLDRVLQATDTIASVLDEVFKESTAPAPHQTKPDRAEADHYRALLAALAEKETWPAGELASLATGLGLMASGAIEAINDQASARGFDPPIDCDDAQCDVDTETLKDLLSHD